MKVSKIIFTSILLIGSLAINAQDLKDYTFKGKVYSYGETCGDVLVEVLEGGELIDSIVTGNNGKFTFETKAEREYMVTLSKEGLKSKTIWLNTKRTQKLPFKLETFKFDVHLKKDKQDKYDEMYELPVALIKYDEGRKAFYMDNSYEDILDRKKDKIKERHRSIRR